jgi:hypothetical protein
MNRAHALPLLVLSASLACSAPAPSKEPTGAALEALQSDLALYRRSLESGDDTAAVAAGRAILRKHPESAAAEEIRRTFPEVEARMAAAEKQERLGDLWAYHTGTEAGGAQSTASVFASEPAAVEGTRMRLVLRRHSQWGTSAYLYAGGSGFSCAEPCTLGLRFDGGAVERWPATLPETGEPAIFVADHDGLVARLGGAERLEVEAALAGAGPSTSVFEVGGFDPAKWLPLGRS